MQSTSALPQHRRATTSAPTQRRTNRPYFPRYSDYCEHMANEAHKQALELERAPRIASSQWTKVRNKMETVTALRSQESDWRRKAASFRLRGK